MKKSKDLYLAIGIIAAALAVSALAVLIPVIMMHSARERTDIKIERLDAVMKLEESYYGSEMIFKTVINTWDSAAEKKLDVNKELDKLYADKKIQQIIQAVQQYNAEAKTHVDELQSKDKDRQYVEQIKNMYSTAQKLAELTAQKPAISKEEYMKQTRELSEQFRAGSRVVNARVRE